MKTNLDQILKKFHEHSYFALFTHKNPDGDAVGSVCALALMLEKLGKRVDLFVQTPLKDTTNLCEITTRFENEFTDRGQTCFVALDCASRDHLYLGEFLPADRDLLVIDHHHTNTLYGDINLVDAGAASAGEVVYGILEALSLPAEGELAKAIYLAVVSDTWYFSFANTTPRSMRIVADLIENGLDFMALNEVIKAKSLEKFELMRIALANARVLMDGKAIFLFIPDSYLGADTEGIVDSARNVKGCLFAALITQVGEKEFRGSLRSNSDEIDVSLLATRLGGGGHKRAAGLTFVGEKEDLFDALASFAREVL